MQGKNVLFLKIWQIFVVTRILIFNRYKSKPIQKLDQWIGRKFSKVTKQTLKLSWLPLVSNKQMYLIINSGSVFI